MCGIAGFAGFRLSRQSASETLRRMTDAMVHRGPDDSGFYVGERASLAMRRLSIVDIAGGHQPMATPDGRLHIVFNGEIYNHADLRADLAARGWGFATVSDTETLLANHSVRGPAGLSKLNGMFGFAVWNETEQKLFLARDRMGVKPLYYAIDGEEIVFASEIKAIVASGLIQPEIDPAAIWHYLTYRFVPGPGTIWRGIMKLPPAHFLEFGVGGGEPKLVRWWDIPYGQRHDQNRSDEELDAEFKSLMEDSIRVRMLADVPVGVLLSGGLDSSVVTAVAARSTSRLRTYSIGFRGAPDANELPYARAVADHVGTNHTDVEIGIDEFRDYLPDFVRQTDEPLADLASVPLRYVSKLAAQNVKVVLSGEGSDEILAGYDLADHVAKWRAASAGSWRARLGRFYRPASTPKTPLPTMTNFLDSAAKAEMFRVPIAAGDTLAPLRARIAESGADNFLDQTLFGFCQDWLVEDLLMKADKMSMAASIELRTPFLDYRLVEWAARAPERAKIGSDDAGRFVGKRILRRYAATCLPQTTIDRPKQGFPVPAYDWLGGPLVPFARELLGSSGCLSGRYLRREALDAALLRGTSSVAGVLDRHRLWNLLVLELWLREWAAR